MRLILALMALALAGPAFADHDLKVAIDRGTYIEPAKVTGSSVAGTAFFSAAVKRMDGIAFNNTATTVWLSTTSATQDNVTHANIGNGFPLLSSATFSLNGIMSDALYFTCNAGTASCEVRVLEGKNR